MPYTKQLLASIVVGIFSVALAVISYPLPELPIMESLPFARASLRNVYGNPKYVDREFTAQNGNKVKMTFEKVGGEQVKLMHAIAQDEKGMTRRFKPTDDALFHLKDLGQESLPNNIWDSYSKMEEVDLHFNTNGNNLMSTKDLPDGVTQKLYRNPYKKGSYLFTQSRVKTDATGKDVEVNKDQYLYREFKDKNGTPIKLRFKMVGDDKVQLNRVTKYNLDDRVKEHYSPTDENQFRIRDLHAPKLPDNVLESLQNSKKEEGGPKSIKSVAVFPENFVQDLHAALKARKEAAETQVEQAKTAVSQNNENSGQILENADSAKSENKGIEQVTMVETPAGKGNENAANAKVADDPTKQQRANVDSSLANNNAATEKVADDPTNQQSANVNTPIATVAKQEGANAKKVTFAEGVQIFPYDVDKPPKQPTKHSVKTEQVKGTGKSSVPQQGADVGSAVAKEFVAEVAPVVQAVSPQPAEKLLQSAQTPSKENGNSDQNSNSLKSATSEKKVTGEDTLVNENVQDGNAETQGATESKGTTNLQSKSKWGKDDVAAGAGVILGTVGLALAAGSLGNTLSHSGDNE